MPKPKVTITLQVTEDTYKQWVKWANMCGSPLSGLIRVAVNRQGAIIAGEKPEHIHVDLTKE